MPSDTDEKTAVYLLARLRRLCRLRKEYGGDLNRLGLALLERAIHATYTDLDDLDAGPIALAVLREHGREDLSR